MENIEQILEDEPDPSKRRWEKRFENDMRVIAKMKRARLRRSLKKEMMETILKFKEIKRKLAILDEIDEEEKITRK